ncbi:MAG: sugar phosphate isomerase/epimerase family protein [Planctomycetaceae bacterium]|nr:sugar phosphate isomerase/epimerase [Planctomycetaceae bacterium]
MRLGICCDLDLVDAAAKAGFDYFEGRVAVVCVPEQDEAAFSRVLAQVKAAPIPCEALNGLMRGDIRITGPGADPAALERYAATVIERAARAQVKMVVFGSGGVRDVRDGFDRDKALDQIVDFGGVLADLAGRHGLTVALEPLNSRECNMINSVAEAVHVMQRINHPAFRVLVDGHHWGRDDLPVGDITDHAALLVHAHVATTPNRLAPGLEPCEKMKEFFAALNKIGYNARVSIEGKMNNPEADLPVALAAMKTLASAS